jgi:hypothetical protein
MASVLRLTTPLLTGSRLPTVSPAVTPLKILEKPHADETFGILNSLSELLTEFRMVVESAI